ncbi:hypothetical protein FC60_GL001400 [Limosilactobacillus gastricus DSM 16045]|uniref:Prenylated flavin chaperone LpdD-like domain-containing protein n=1 Tax=Limosilactobacillus gastricus DSM 16045 TaxID=1423749 RepID=A0A0R1VC73_9LACO|nr:hypothetical protein FC60_GL001400 [Limosilactobacillus gastricus DSM 16045]
MNFTIQKSGLQMQAELKIINGDLLIVLTGGDTPHIGTITAFDQATRTITTTQFTSHDNRKHKDQVLAEELLNIIRPVLPGNCVITSGVHVNRITKAQIQATFPMAQNLGQQIKAWLQELPLEIKKPEYH